MKKGLTALMAVMLAALTLAGCSSSKNASKDVVHLGILQYVEHPSLTAARKGFVDELKKEGYVEGKNLKLDYENAQGDQSNLQTISTNLLSNNDLVLGIATPAAQTLSNLSSDVPVVFIAVTDPVSAKLVDTMETPNISTQIILAPPCTIYTDDRQSPVTPHWGWRSASCGKTPQWWARPWP